jgi:hypothetical protein
MQRTSNHLRFGPYRMPRCKIGGKLEYEYKRSKSPRCPDVPECAEFAAGNATSDVVRLME